MSAPKIKVLIVDDTAVARLQLAHLLGADARIEVAGAVTDGLAALEFLKQNKPDVVLMDLHMPQMDGFETTRLIMESQPVPIIICTATGNPDEVQIAFRSMEAGAVACVDKPAGYGHPRHQSQVDHLLQTVKLMSEVKVVRRWPRSRANLTSTGRTRALASDIQMIGVGASTGGPPVLQTVLAGLPKDFPVPLMIVQHIARGFLPGLVDWLNQTSSLSVQIAAHGATPLPGHAYVAPDDYHMGLDAQGRIQLARTDPENGLRPAVSYLFRSLAETLGPAALGVLLTGMGRDGAEELKLMRERGSETIAQDRYTSVVHGMPGAAIALGAAGQVLPADKIAPALLILVNSRLKEPANKGTGP